jgi:hypothetical protein
VRGYKKETNLWIMSVYITPFFVKKQTELLSKVSTVDSRVKARYYFYGDEIRANGVFEACGVAVAEVQNKLDIVAQDFLAIKNSLSMQIKREN